MMDKNRNVQINLISTPSSSQLNLKPEVLPDVLGFLAPKSSKYLGNWKKFGYYLSTLVFFVRDDFQHRPSFLI